MLRRLLILFVCWLGGGAVLAQSQQFYVIRASTDIANGSQSKTLTNGVDYTLDGAATTSNSFIRITSEHGVAVGAADSGNPGALRAPYITNPSNLLTSITVTRATTCGTCNFAVKFTWEIIQYLGASGGADEIIVRGVGQGTIGSGAVNTADGSTITTISNINRAALLVTSSSTDQSSTASQTASKQLTGAFVASGSDWIPRLSRWAVSVGPNDFSYAVVEFVGSNWRDVQRLEINPIGAAGYTTYDLTTAGMVDFLDVSKVFLEVQFKHGSPGFSARQRITTLARVVNTTSIALQSYDNSDGAIAAAVIWMIESTSPSMFVQRSGVITESADTDTNVFETRTFDFPTAVDDVSNASVWGMGRLVKGTGSGGMLGVEAQSFILSDTDTVTMIEANAVDDERKWVVELVQWPHTDPGRPANVISEVHR